MSSAMLTAMRSADSFTESHARCGSRGCLDPAMTEQPADDRQPVAERRCLRGGTVASDVNVHVAELGLCADALARSVEIRHVRAGLHAWNYPRISRLSRKCFQDVGRRRGQVDRAVAVFPVDDVDLGPVEIHMLQRRVRITFRRQPVGISRRIVAVSQSRRLTMERGGDALPGQGTPRGCACPACRDCGLRIACDGLRGELSPVERNCLTGPRATEAISRAGRTRATLDEIGRGGKR